MTIVITYLKENASSLSSLYFICIRCVTTNEHSQGYRSQAKLSWLDALKVCLLRKILCMIFCHNCPATVEKGSPILILVEAFDENLFSPIIKLNFCGRVYFLLILLLDLFHVSHDRATVNEEFPKGAHFRWPRCSLYNMKTIINIWTNIYDERHSKPLHGPIIYFVSNLRCRPPLLPFRHLRYGRNDKQDNSHKAQRRLKPVSVVARRLVVPSIVFRSEGTLSAFLLRVPPFCRLGGGYVMDWVDAWFFRRPWLFFFLLIMTSSFTVGFDIGVDDCADDESEFR